MYEPAMEEGFEQVQILRDPVRSILIFLAIHSTRLGPAFGGVRRWSYRDPGEALVDALRLAEAMTWKCAVAGVPGGGGKAVIVDSRGLDRRAAYRLLARHVEQMGGRFCTGADVGTGPEELDLMAAETRFVTTPGAAGPGDLAESTALGVLAGIEAVFQRLGRDHLKGATVGVQGLGAVGWHLCSLLAGSGARLLVADIRVDRVEAAVRRFGADPVDCTEILSAPCDLLAPCALGGVLDARGVSALQAKAVAGAANNVLGAPEDGERLHERGILYAPDFAINAGGLIRGATFFLKGVAPGPERIRGIGATIGRILDESRGSGIPPHRVALQIARDRVAGASPEPYFPPR